MIQYIFLRRPDGASLRGIGIRFVKIRIYSNSGANMGTSSRRNWTGSQTTRIQVHSNNLFDGSTKTLAYKVEGWVSLGSQKAFARCRQIKRLDPVVELTG